jgi:hypothetical protein
MYSAKNIETHTKHMYSTDQHTKHMKPVNIRNTCNIQNIRNLAILNAERNRRQQNTHKNNICKHPPHEPPLSTNQSQASTPQRVRGRKQIQSQVLLVRPSFLELEQVCHTDIHESCLLYMTYTHTYISAHLVPKHLVITIVFMMNHHSKGGQAP